MEFAIKAAVSDPFAKTFVFSAQKTMYGGKRIAAGDTIYVFASENEGGTGLIACGVVVLVKAMPRRRSVERQTPRVSITMRRGGIARRRLGRSELRRFTAWHDGRPQTELNFKLYRQATNKLVGISTDAAAFLAGFFTPSSAKTTIRTYVPGDERQVTALWRNVFPDDPPWNEPKQVIRRKRAMQPDLLLVAEVERAVVGAVIAGYDGVRGWIYHLAVTPKHRRQGLGRALMAEAETRLRRLGCVKINLQVRSNNSSVLAFYRRLDYRVEKRVSFGKRIA